MYDAVVITDPNGHILETNPRAVEYFQYNEEEMSDRPVGMLVPGISPSVVQRLRRGMSEDRRMMLDGSCKRKDGTTFPAEISVSQIDLYNPGDLVFTLRNTERRRRQTEKFKSIENAFSISSAALFACDADGRFRFANDAFVDLFGFEDEDEAVRATFAETMPDNPLPAMFSAALEGRESSIRIKADSDEGSEELEITLAPDSRGRNVCGVVGSVLRV